MNKKLELIKEAKIKAIKSGRYEDAIILKNKEKALMEKLNIKDKKPILTEEQKVQQLKIENSLNELREFVKNYNYGVRSTRK